MTRFSIDIVGYPTKKRKIAKIKAAALHEVADQWQKKFSLLHFTAQGARKYHYTRRKTKDITAGTVRRKRNKKPKAPDPRPLVWSGRSLALSRQYKVRSTQTAAHLTTPVKAFNYQPKHANPGLNMREEYRTVLPSELRTLSVPARRVMYRELKKNKIKLKGGNLKVVS